MRSEQIREIADAILYEGYLLYPYRHSSIKNRQRWTFGVVYPRIYSEKQGINEPWQMRTECLVTGPAEAKLAITMRFLHLLKHTTEQEEDTISPRRQGYATWEEGIAREIEACNLSLHQLTKQTQNVAISIPAQRLAETQAGEGVNTTIRVQGALAGTMIIAAEEVEEEIFKVSVVIENTGLIAGEEEYDPQRVHVNRDCSLTSGMVSIGATKYFCTHLSRHIQFCR